MYGAKIAGADQDLQKDRVCCFFPRVISNILNDSDFYVLLEGRVT